MKRRLLSSAGVFLVLYAANGLGQEPQATSTSSPTEGVSIPAASRTQMDCAGFIAAGGVARDIIVKGGADDDFQAPSRQFETGQFVYLTFRRGARVTVGAEFSIVRPASQQFHIPWYPGEGRSIRGSGQPFEDVGRVKVISLTPQGAVAEVTFACVAIVQGDIAVPYQARAIPEYTPGQSLDRFAVAKAKLTGIVTAARDNNYYLGTGSVAYVNLGTLDKVRPGQRFRVFRVVRDPARYWQFKLSDNPRESVGELVILSAYEKSSTAIVVNCLRDITVGDGIELE